MEFMATHPRGFASLEDAADVIAAYNPHRRRPDTLDGLAKVLRRTGDGRWCWRWDPAFMSSKVDAMRADPDQRSQRLEQLTGKLLTGASRITAPTLLIRGAMSDLVSPETVTEFLDIVPHATAIDISDTGHMVAGDNNDAFSAAVVEFLRNIGPTRHTAETTH
jgi:pimeloyl-ACP methyl ester carboxylesterase